MAKQIEVEINYKGLLELFRSDEMQGICVEAAEAVADAARGMAGIDEGGYNVSEYRGPHRAGAAVWCNSLEARRDNSKNNTLLKAVGSVIPADKIVKK